jgi:hypothetical protein
MSVRVDPAVLRYEAVIRGLSMRDLGRKAGLCDATMCYAATSKPMTLRFRAATIDHRFRAA